VNDLTGENRRFLLRALIIAGNDPEGDGSGQRALTGRGADVQAMFERAAARGEPSAGLPGYFEAVVGPMYGYALLLPGLVRRRAPVLVEQFLASLDRTTTAHDEREELRHPGKLRIPEAWSSDGRLTVNSRAPHGHPARSRGMPGTLRDAASPCGHRGGLVP
jgi:hypothetical protein